MFLKFIKHFDMFTSLPTLRVGGDSEFASLCGGVFSLILLLCFTYIFTVRLIEIVQLRTIYSMEIIQMNRPQNEILYDQTVAIGLFGHNIVEMGSFFNIVAYVMTPYGMDHYISMRPCVREDWALISDQQYNAFKISQCFCPVDKAQLNQTGYFSSQTFGTSSFHIYQCTNLTYPGTCAPRTQLQQIFQTQFNYLVGKFLIMNTAFNPSEKNPISYYVNQKFIWLPLELEFSAKIFTSVGTWQVKTDEGFFPWPEMNVQKGYFVDEYVTFTAQGVGIPTILDLYILNSRKNKTILREFGKIDTLLSYVGGLFGIVLSFFAFFMISYNEYRYELWVSQSSFTFKKGRSVRAKHFHFLKYAKYVVYDWINLLTCCKPKWKQCRIIDETRQEAIEQIQVSYLLKRIAYLENVIKTLVKKEDRTSIYLIQPESIEQIKQNREYANYYSAVSEGETQTTIASLKMASGILGFVEKFKETQTNFPSDARGLTTPKLVSFRDENLTSLEMMDKYLGDEDEWKKQITLTDEQKKIEEQLSEDFYEMSQDTRIQIIEQIPLPILYRLRQRKNIKNSTGYYEDEDECESQTESNRKNNKTNKQGSMISILKFAKTSKRRPQKTDMNKKSRNNFGVFSSFYCNSENQSCQEKGEQ